MVNETPPLPCRSGGVLCSNRCGFACFLPKVTYFGKFCTYYLHISKNSCTFAPSFSRPLAPTALKSGDMLIFSRLRFIGILGM